MKFSSYEEILSNYIFLKTVVSELEESYFLYMTGDEILSEKNAIIDELKNDTSFPVPDPKDLEPCCSDIVNGVFNRN